MADKHPPDKHSSSGSSEDGGSGLISEQELEEVLAQASALATDLSEQLGMGGDDPSSDSLARDSNIAPAAAGTETGDSDSIDNLPQDLDAELGELERLIAATRSDVTETGEGSDEPAPSAEAPAQVPEEPAVADPGPGKSVPDARDDPPVDQRSSESAGPGADLTFHAVSVKPGIVGSGKIGVVGTHTVSPKVDASAPMETPDEPAEADDTPQKFAGIANVIRGAATHLSPTVLAGCERAVNLLELIDRPLGRIGDPVRRLIGWVAIATIATSLLVFLYSLF